MNKKLKDHSTKASSYPKNKLKKVEAWLKLQKNGKDISAQTLSSTYFVMAKLPKMK